jgi:hypothetical protein
VTSQERQIQIRDAGDGRVRQLTRRLAILAVGATALIAGVAATGKNTAHGKASTGTTQTSNDSSSSSSSSQSESSSSSGSSLSPSSQMPTQSSSPPAAVSGGT